MDATYPRAAGWKKRQRVVDADYFMANGRELGNICNDDEICVARWVTVRIPSIRLAWTLLLITVSNSIPLIRLAWALLLITVSNSSQFILSLDYTNFYCI